jgi:hypothetical protein
MTQARAVPLLSPARIALFLCVLLAAPSFAQDAQRPAQRDGFAVGAFLSQFIGGDSGPVTLLSETMYPDTFSTGGGLRLEVYREFESGWRGQLGLVYSAWRGKFFTGGEFPTGAQFGDFSLAGVYVGGRYAIGGGERYQPYVLGNLGLVYLSELEVHSGGQTIPYWTGNWRDYFELGIGAARKTGGGGRLTMDVRFQIFGAPEAATWPIAAATGGISFLLGIGYEWDRGR